MAEVHNLLPGSKLERIKEKNIKLDRFSSLLTLSFLTLLNRQMHDNNIKRMRTEVEKRSASGQCKKKCFINSEEKTRKKKFEKKSTKLRRDEKSSAENSFGEDEEEKDHSFELMNPPKKLHKLPNTQEVKKVLNYYY